MEILDLEIMVVQEEEADMAEQEVLPLLDKDLMVVFLK